MSADNYRGLSHMAPGCAVTSMECAKKSPFGFRYLPPLCPRSLTISPAERAWTRSPLGKPAGNGGRPRSRRPGREAKPTTWLRLGADHLRAVYRGRHHVLGWRLLMHRGMLSGTPTRSATSSCRTSERDTGLVVSTVKVGNRHRSYIDPRDRLVDGIRCFLLAGRPWAVIQVQHGDRHSRCFGLAALY